jgi:arsenate reductase
MDELEIDLRDRVPRRLAQADAEWADVVVTMGCGDECPFVPGRRYVDWDLPDPKGKDIETVRQIRDEIEKRVRALTLELDARS